MSDIKLRALSMKDLPVTLAWNNADEIKEMYAGHPFPVNEEMEKIWYEKILTSNFPITAFGIEIEKTKELIGLSFLKNINMIHRSAELAIFIGDKKNKGKGYSKSACLQTLTFAFKDLGLNRVWLKVLANNTIALNLYKKLGFIKEGMLRESAYKSGMFIDEIIMSVLSTEFYA